MKKVDLINIQPPNENKIEDKKRIIIMIQNLKTI